MNTDASCLLVLSTFPDEARAADAARALVADRLAACANIVPGLKSIYRWQGAVEENAEVLVLFKITPERYDAFAARLRELHPYEVPEILCFPAAAGLPAYLSWVTECCAP
jgi:periplasmic divalent cation tolerance protein